MFAHLSLEHIGEGDKPSISFWIYGAITLIIFVIIHVISTFYLHWVNSEREKKLEISRNEESFRKEQLKNKMLLTELHNKNNELMQQTSLLISKGTLIHSLMEELDHQKKLLGDRYPNKMYNRLKGMMENALNDQNDWNAFESYFNKTHQDFIDRLKSRYNDLTIGDIRLCCMLRMNLSTKETASILNISVRAVELRRYRLRKRIGLDSEQNLTDFLMNF